MGAEPPVYAHLPLLHGPDGKKLSKRHGAASVQELRDAGYLPEAVRNYLALLGWGYDEETTFHTTEELKQRFSLERVSQSPAVFDEQKLRWMNGRYLRELPLDELTARLEDADGPHGAARRGRRSPRTRSPRWPSSGRSRASSSTARRTIPPRARRCSARRARATRWAGARAALAELPAPWTLEAVETALRGVVGARGAEAQAGLPAAAGGARRDHGLTRDLRDGRAAGARRDPGTGRRCACGSPARLKARRSGKRAVQPSVHCCRYALKAGSHDWPDPPRPRHTD